jgi:hypothetical protein
MPRGFHYGAAWSALAPQQRRFIGFARRIRSFLP